MNQTYKFSAYPTFSLHHQPLTVTSKNSVFGLPHRDYDFYNLMSVLTNSYDRETAIYNFITNLKADLNITELSEMFDCMYMFAAPTSGDSLINWVNPNQYNCTLNGTVGTGALSMRFTANRGWNCNGLSTTTYLNTNFNPYNINCNFNGNISSNINNVGGSFGIYLNNYFFNLAGDFYIMGATSGTTSGSPILLAPRNGGSDYIFGCQNTTRFNLNQYTSCLQGLEGGLISVVKPSFSLVQLFYNGNLVQNKNLSNSNTILFDAGPILIGGINLNATGSTATPLNTNSRSVAQITFVYIGSNKIKPDIVFRRLQEYLISINGSTFITASRLS